MLRIPYGAIFSNNLVLFVDLHNTCIMYITRLTCNAPGLIGQAGSVRSKNISLIRQPAPIWSALSHFWVIQVITSLLFQVRKMVFIVQIGTKMHFCEKTFIGKTP